MKESLALEILKDWNFWGEFDEKLIERLEYTKKLKELWGKECLVLYGVRRAGKSCIAHYFIKNLIVKRIFNESSTLIINFEDPRFPVNIDACDLFDIYECYIKHLSPDKRHIVLLDEVQVVKGWEKFVRYLIEAKKVNCIVTGSSSKLLSREYATVLTGRHLDIEIFPLSFKEFLYFKKLAVKSLFDITKQKIEILRKFDEYLHYGSFPEIVLTESIRRKRELLATYFNDIIVKDVERRFRIKNVEKLEELANIYISNTATLQSYNKLKKVLKTSLDSIERISKYLEIARLFIFLKKFSYSVAEQTRSIKKVYCIDLGFNFVKGFRFSKNFGKLYENLVAIDLKRREKEIYYWKDYYGREVDFVLKEGMEVKELIQVCYDIDDFTTKEREIKGLLKASEELKCRNLLVITEDYEETEEHKGKKIKFIPLWKWLLFPQEEGRGKLLAD